MIIEARHDSRCTRTHATPHRTQETLIERLLYWAERADSHPLNVYSLVLLGAAAEFGEEHARQIEERTRALIPSVIQRLYELNMGLARHADEAAADETTVQSGMDRALALTL